MCGLMRGHSHSVLKLEKPSPTQFPELPSVAEEGMQLPRIETPPPPESIQATPQTPKSAPAEGERRPPPIPPKSQKPRQLEQMIRHHAFLSWNLHLLVSTLTVPGD